MSLVEQLREAQAAVVRRLAELEPLVDEYNELRREAERLGMDLTRVSASRASADGTSSRPAPARRRGAPAGRTAKTQRKPAASGTQATPAARSDRPDRVAALVADRPGITVAQVGKELEVDPTSLYRVVRKLEEDGRLVKKGRTLQPA